MKSAVIWVMCTVVVAASALIIADKVMDVVDRRAKHPTEAPRANPDLGKADPALLARLDKVEKVLESVREMLQIPPPEDTNLTAMGPETRDGEPSGPPPQAGIGERLQWIESELSDLRRQANRDLMQIYTRLRRRLDEMEAKLIKDGAPDSRATIADLKKLGVDYKADEKLITMEAAFAQPTRVLEFVAVGVGGDVHESLLVLNAKPSALKRALELMGIAEAPNPPYDPSRLSKDSFVYVYLTWPGRKTPVRVEKLLRNISTGRLLDATPFIFTASRPFIDIRTWDEHLAADIHKQTIGLTWNYAGECVLACPAREAESEHVWTPEVDALPETPGPATILISKEPRPEWE
jgi:hypothetical protein